MGISRTALLAALLAGCLLLPVRASGPVVRLDPSPATVGLGQTAAIELRVEGVEDLYGLEVRLAFDPTVVEVVDADPATDGVQVRPGDLLRLDLVARNTVDNAQGTVWFVLSQIGPSPPVSGSGTAFIVTVCGKAFGARSPLRIVEAVLATAAGEAIAAQWEDGEVAVVGEAEAPPTPTPAPTLAPPALTLPTVPPTSTPASVEGATATPERPAEASSPPPTAPAINSPTAPPMAPATNSPTAPPAAATIATRTALPTAAATASPSPPTGGGGWLAALPLVAAGLVGSWWLRRRGRGSRSRR